MTTDIFIKTFWKDIEWLKVCLKSITKFVSGFDNVVIVAPLKEQDLYKGLNFTLEKVLYINEPTTDGYTWQQAVKLNAHHYSSADRILYVDSDCVFIKPVTPEYFLSGDKPYMLFTPYDKLGKVPWRSGTEFVLGRPVPFEFMRRHPMMYPREVLEEFAEFILKRFGMSVTDFMLENCAKHSLSEFNILGAFAYYYMNDRFVWMNTEDGKHPPDCLMQFWSYSGPQGKENAERIKQAMEILDS